MKKYFKLPIFARTLTFCGLIFSVLSFGQEDKKYAVSLKPFYGIGVGNSNKIGVESNFTLGIDARFHKKLNPEDADWIKFLNAKEVSLGFVYNDLDHIERENYTFGKSFGILMKADFELYKKNNFSLELSPGFGLAYLTRTVKTDPNTLIFGSHINGMFMADLIAEYQISKDWAVMAGTGIIHYSNGGAKVPNAGLNTMNFSVGVKKDIIAFKNCDNDSIKTPIPDMKKNGFEFSAGAGSRGRYKKDGGFFMMGFYGGYNRFLNNVISLRAGVDAVYYSELYDEFFESEQSLKYWGQSYDHYRVGLSIGAEAKLNKIGIGANYGYYLHMNSLYNQKTYWDLNLKYYITPKIGIQGTMYAHRFQADFVNWGVFYRL